MPVETRARRQAAQAAADVAGAAGIAAVPGLLALIFDRLPAGARFFTVGGVNKEWRAWAEARPGDVTDKNGRGALDVVKWAWETDRSMHSLTCHLAAAGGHTGVMEFAWTNAAARCAQDMCWHAAHAGHLETLKVAFKLLPIWDEDLCANGAAIGGHLHVLEWLRRGADPPCPMTAKTCWRAAEAGQLASLQWLRKEKVPWGKMTCSEAARGGHLEVLQWAVENGCPWDKKWTAEVCRDALTEAWLRGQGCPASAFRNQHRYDEDEDEDDFVDEEASEHE